MANGGCYLLHTHLWSWPQKTPSTGRIWQAFLLLCGIAWGFQHFHSRPWETSHPHNSQTSFPPERHGHPGNWSRTDNQIHSLRVSEVTAGKSLCKEYQYNLALFTGSVPAVLLDVAALTMAEMTRTTLTGSPLPEGGTSLLSSTNRQASRIPSSNWMRERETTRWNLKSKHGPKLALLNKKILVAKLPHIFAIL